MAPTILARIVCVPEFSVIPSDPIIIIDISATSSAATPSTVKKNRVFLMSSVKMLMEIPPMCYLCENSKTE